MGGLSVDLGGCAAWAYLCGAVAILVPAAAGLKRPWERARFAFAACTVAVEQPSFCAIRRILSPRASSFLICSSRNPRKDCAVASGS